MFPRCYRSRLKSFQLCTMQVNRYTAFDNHAHSAVSAHSVALKSQPADAPAQATGFATDDKSKHAPAITPHSYPANPRVGCGYSCTKRHFAALLRFDEIKINTGFQRIAN